MHIYLSVSVPDGREDLKTERQCLLYFYIQISENNVTCGGYSIDIVNEWKDEGWVDKHGVTLINISMTF